MMIKSVKFPSSGGGEEDTSAFFDNVFAGRWMSSVGESRGPMKGSRAVAGCQVRRTFMSMTCSLADKDSLE